MQVLPPFRWPLLSSLLAVSFSALAADPATLPVVHVESATPSQDGSISRDELQASQARDVREAFRADAEISVSGGANPSAQKLYVRGMDQSLLNVSIDGATQNGHLYHHQNALVIDPQLLKRIEVEKGTTAASAGPGALAGAMRLETVDALDLLRPGQSQGGNVSGGLSSNQGWRGLGSVYARSGQFDGLFAASYQDLDDYKSGNGQTVDYSASKQRNVLAKLGFAPQAGQRISFGYQQSGDDGVRTVRPNMVVFNHPVLPNDPIPQTLRRDTSTLRYQGSNMGWLSSADSTLYGSKIAGSRTSKAGRDYGESITTTGFDLGLGSALGQHLLRYGLNWRNEASQADNTLNPYGNIGRAQEEMSVLGGYAESMLDLGSVDLSAGLRYDSYRYHDRNDQHIDSHGFSPSAAAGWQLLPTLKLRAAYTRALRGMGLEEPAMLDLAYWVNDASAKAEQANNLEAGWVFQQGGMGFSGNIYRQIIDNFIGTGECADGSDCRTNLGQVRVNGYELAASYRLGGLNARLSVAESRPELEGRPLNDGDFGLGVSYGRNWIGQLGYQWSSLQLGWLVRYVQPYDYQPFGAATDVTMTKQGYVVHDLNLNWQPLQRDTLRIDLAMNNLFDKQYYAQSTYAFNAGRLQKVLGYPEPGRDVRLQATWRF